MKVAPYEYDDVLMFDGQTDSRNGLVITERAVGKYDRRGDCITYNGNSYSIKNCTNIVKLAPEVK